ncbi:hypothetical protein [Echinicola jeungdonensis]|uniref:hypothetical protein n=1 Tax=Echinicola jeungdonensis TaxID=709343 RepID=UPI00338D3B07
MTAHSNDILLDKELFELVNSVFQKRDSLSLDEEQQTLLEKTYKAFVRNGANLSDEDKLQLREIDKELAQYSLQFGENVLAETNKYEMVVDNEEDLKGLPEAVIEAAAQTASERGKMGIGYLPLPSPATFHL